jgi:hypothetical protein
LLPTLAMPDQAMASSPTGDAVADRLAAGLHVIEVVVVGIDHDGAGGFLAVIVDDGAAERFGYRDLGVAVLASNSLSRGLKFWTLVAS